MRVKLIVLRALVAGWAFVSVPAATLAEEFAFSSYGLGGAAFGAGVTPPPGTYVSFVGGFYAGDIRGNITIGGVAFDAGARVEFFQAAVNGLHVLDRTVLGGRLGLAVTIPVGHIDMAAGLVVGPIVVTRQTDGWGLGDITTRAQLGWEHGNLSHLFYVQGVVPTGRYDSGFSPNIGLNRPGIDTGWAFTYADKKSKWQFNGALGMTFNFENDDTDYLSGNNLHVEWAIGREISPGLVLGVVGYDYRQLTGDSGPGAVLGPFKGNVDAIGPGLSYSTLVGKTPLILNLRHYQEFNAERRWDGHMTIFSGTVPF